jgi:heme oxygenase
MSVALWRVLSESRFLQTALGARGNHTMYRSSAAKTCLLQTSLRSRSQSLVSETLATLTGPVSSVALLTQPTLLDTLRLSTAGVHERLHGHLGLAAVQAGTIDRKAYRALLMRLYGFHRPFEVAARLAPQRTTWLESDLEVLGVNADKRAALPRCASFSEKALREFILGARYVVEGSALGGRSLARQLDDLLGPDMMAGRQFFSGYGSATGVVWRDFLMQLSAVPDVGTKRATVVEGAIETFAVFEQWLKGWDEPDE